MKRFKSLRQAQRFLSAHGPIHQHSHPRRHRMSAAEYRAYRTQAFEVWKQETCVRRAA
jgi:putative transposase